MAQIFETCGPPIAYQVVTIVQHRQSISIVFQYWRGMDVTQAISCIRR